MARNDVSSSTDYKNKKHFCDVKICPAAIYSATTCAFLYSVLTTKAWVFNWHQTREGKENHLVKFAFFKFWFHMKWTNHKLRFDIYRRHMHKSFELCCVLSCFADYSSTRPLTACRVSSTTGAGPTWGRFVSMFFFVFFRGSVQDFYSILCVGN